MNRFVGNSPDESYTPICGQCKHYFLKTLKCEAFPDEIPKEILAGRFDHHNPHLGDNGIRFEHS
jgi:hypothetical protein